MNSLSDLLHFCHLQVFWEMLFNKLELAGNSAQFFHKVFKSLIINKMCAVCSATLISWSHTAQSSGVLGTVHNFGLYPSSFAMSASQKNKRIMPSCIDTHTIFFLLQKGRILCVWEFSWKNSRDSSSPPVCPCLSQLGQTNKQKSTDLTYRHDWLLRFTLVGFAAFLVFCLFGFCFMVLVFSHSLLFLAIAASWPTDLAFLLAQRL